MNYLDRAVNYVNAHIFRRSAKIEQEQEEVEVELTTIDEYLNYVCKVICWEDPTLTWISFLVINAIYMFVIIFEIRFFCLVFTTLALIVVLDYYGKSLSFKDLKHYVYFKDIKRKCLNFLYNMHGWKRENPSLFCGFMIGFFLTLSIIGRTISGRALLYYIILGLYFGPQLYCLIPKNFKDTLTHIITTIRTNEGIVEENDLIPIISPENDFNDDNDSLITDHTQDSVTNSLISGLGVMPSHMEVDVDDLDEVDLLPTKDSVEGDTSNSSDSDYENRDIMKFDALHFNKDSSSDEEHLSAKAVTSTMANTVQNVGQTLGAGMYQSLAAIGNNFLSNYMHTPSQAKANIDTARQDSDSDFEIINSDEANVR